MDIGELRNRTSIEYASTNLTWNGTYNLFG